MSAVEEPSVEKEDRKRRKKRYRDEDFGFKVSSGVNYNVIHDRHVDDVRFERQIKARQSGGNDPPAPAPKTTSTVDALQRMVLGKESRTIKEKFDNPNRITWEQYKKENKDKLEIGNEQEKEMMKYRAELDAAREKRLSKGMNRKSQKLRGSSDSDSSSDEDSKKSKKKKKKHKRRKSKERKRKRRRGDSDSESEAEDKKRKKEKRKKKKDKKRFGSQSSDNSPVRLSEFLAAASESD